MSVPGTAIPSPPNSRTTRSVESPRSVLKFTCFTGTNLLGQILTQKAIDGDEEDSRVCSTVISFDPERGSGSSGPSHSSSREFDPEAARRDRDSASEKRPVAAAAPVAPVAPVAVTLKLALDFSSIAGPAERAAFEKDLVGDLMSATGESSVSTSYFYTSSVSTSYVYTSKAPVKYK